MEDDKVILEGTVGGSGGESEKEGGKGEGGKGGEMKGRKERGKE